jgi:methylated-DNA-protein-cysteine methyltransferase-like protein
MFRYYSKSRSGDPFTFLPVGSLRRNLMPQRFASPRNREAYYALVWEIVRQIPKGRVATYGQIGGMIPPPEGMNDKDYLAWAARWVGGAMANCPSDVPWQRVINAQGKISLRPGGAQKQRQLLEDEGLRFDAQERIDLKQCGWDGPAPEWRIANGLRES